MNDDQLKDELDDPALLAFLIYLDRQMTIHQELIVEADYVQLERIENLVKDVKYES